MTIDLTSEEYRALLERVIIGTFVREAVAAARLELDLDPREIEQKILSAADKFGYADLVTKHGDHLDLADKSWEEIRRILDEFANDEFWERLAEELGRRDFRRVATPAELAEIKKTGVYPERVRDFMERYEEEFEEYDTDRLEINLLAPAVEKPEAGIEESEG